MVLFFFVSSDVVWILLGGWASLCALGAVRCRVYHELGLDIRALVVLAPPELL